MLHPDTDQPAVTTHCRAPQDWVEVPSRYEFAETLQRLLDVIEAAGMTVFAQIDHNAAAASVGLSMPPTRVLVFGNPKAGTPLMLEAPPFALDLPLKLLVRVAGAFTLVGFYPVQTQARCWGLTDAQTAPLQRAQALILATISW